MVIFPNKFLREMNSIKEKNLKILVIVMSNSTQFYLKKNMNTLKLRNKKTKIFSIIVLICLVLFNNVFEPS